MFIKSILIAVVLLQLAIAVTTTGSVRSLAELSAFLVIVGMLCNQHRNPLSKKLY